MFMLEEENSPRDQLEIALKKANLFLETYGMNQLDPGNPFDCLILYALAAEYDTEFVSDKFSATYDALASLNLSLSVWSSQISAQEKVLEQAAISDVLDNRNPNARGSLQQQMERQRRSLDALYAVPLDTALLERLGEIAEKKNLFSLELFQQICSRHQELESITQDTMFYLEDALCSEASPYNTRDKRERLVKSYQDYLEAETQYLSYLLAALMTQMTPEQQGEIWEAMTYMEALDGFYDGPGSVNPDRLPDGTNRALETLKDARREMNAQGFSIDWPETGTSEQK